MACQSSCHHIRHKITLCYVSNPKPCTFTCITTKNVWIDIQSENKYCLRFKDLLTMHHLKTVVFKNGFDFFLLHYFAYPRVPSSLEGLCIWWFWSRDQFRKVIFFVFTIGIGYIRMDPSPRFEMPKSWRSQLEASFTKVN